MYVIGSLRHIVTMETLKVTTYNMHSFQSGLSCLTDLCDSGICDIICVQAHWLVPYNLNKLQNFNAEFYCLCWSAMVEKLHSGLLKGRPFGGIGVLINKQLHVKIRVLDVMSNCRCASVHCSLCLSKWSLRGLVYYILPLC